MARAKTKTTSEDTNIYTDTVNTETLETGSETTPNVDSPETDPTVPVEVFQPLRLDTVASSNISLLEFPSDPLGLTYELKKGARKTLAKVTADPEKLKVILSTLEKLASYAMAKYLDASKQS